MARIAIDARIINSGTGRYVERLLNYLQKLETEHEFIVLVRREDKYYWRPSAKNFCIEVADFANYSWGEQIGFYKFLKELNADLVHFCMPQQPLLYNAKKITTIHDLSLVRIEETDDMSQAVLKIKQQIFAQLLKRVARTSEVILTPSEYTKRDLVSFAKLDNPEKVKVTYESADKLNAEKQGKDFFPASLSKLDKRKFLLFVGRAEPYKNNRGLIKAHQLLLSRFPELKLVIVGKIDEFRRRDQSWVEENGYKNIHFYGFAGDAELAWLYEHCAAYVFPSFMEGFGLPGLEAMQHGAPVISSDRTCLPEVYGDAALYINPKTPTKMAKIIEKLLSSPVLAETLRTKGQKQVKKYSWEKMARQTLEAYENALSA